MSAERSVVVRVRAEIGDFKKNMADAEKSASALADAAAKSSTKLDQAGASGKAAGAAVGEAGTASEKTAGQMDKAGDSAKSAGEKQKASLQDAAKAAGEAAAGFGFAYDANGKLVDGMGQMVPATTAAKLGLASVVDTFDDLGNKIEPAQSSWSKFSSTVTASRGELQAAGGALAAFGGAIVGVATASLATGIAYNTLQQTTRSALTTLMGSAAQANAQMDKLDDFARTSPFAKQVFIRAQQQLIGFGMAAEKVVPTLDAIQNAVAAVGGSSEDIGEIANILAKVTSTGKITAITLNQLGLRGVDAATIIGDQMGKTGLQIRDDISDGALGAEAALDALTAGMQDKFDGAAAGLKDTFVGAGDRIKSAFRDISASIAEPFVSQSGGGMLVDWLNQTADAMRSFEKLDPIVKTSIISLGGLVGVGALAAGTFLLMLPRIVMTIDAFKRLNGVAPVLGKSLGAVGKAAGIAVAALLLFKGIGSITSHFSKALPELKDFENSLLNVGTGIGTLDTKMKMGGGLTTSIDGIGDALKRFSDINWFDKLSNAMGDAVGMTRSFTQDLVAKVDGVDQALAKMAEGGNAKGAAEAFTQIAAEGALVGVSLEKTAEAMPAYIKTLEDRATALKVNIGEGEQAITQEELYQWALGETPAMITAVMNTEEGAAVVAKDLAEKTEALAEELADVGVSASGSIVELDKFMDALFNAGLATMSTRDASMKWNQSIRDMGGEIEKIIGSQWELGDVLNETGTDFNDQTTAGYNANTMLQGLVQEGMNVAKTFSGDVKKSQEDVQQQLTDTYNNAITAANGFGIHGEAAENLARELMGIPDDIKIESWMSDQALRMAEAHNAALDALNGKTVNTYVLSNYKSIYSEEHVSNGVGGSGGQQKATGGAIFGPGTGTSDEIPAWLSNGEHVWTANEVNDVGGQGAMYRLRAAARAGKLPAFANGGAVGGTVQRFAVGGEAGHLGESANSRANRLYREAQAVVKAAAKAEEKAVKDAAKAQDKAAKAMAAANEKATKAAKKAADEKAAAAKKVADAEASQAKSRWQQGNALYLDNSKGQGYGTVTNGLSSAYSYSDRLRSLADSGNSLTPRRALLNVSNKAESALRGLYAQSEKLDASLKGAKERFESLTQVKDGISSALSGEFNLDSAVKKSAFYGVANIKDIQKSASMSLGRIKTFGSKLNQLQKKGYSGAIVQEIAAMGSADGIQAANALLGASGKEVKNLNSTYSQIDSASDAAGTYVTNAMYKGGLNAAAGLIQGLESQQGAIEKQMLKIGLGMEKALKQALGIRSPSRKARAIGSNFGSSVTLGMADEMGGIAKQSKAIGDTMYVAPSKSMAAEYAGRTGSGRAAPAPVAPVLDYAKLAAVLESRPVVANLKIGNKDVASANIAGRKELRLTPA